MNLSKLACIPLLLYLICVLHCDEHGRLKSNMSMTKLYEELIDYMIRRWERGYKITEAMPKYDLALKPNWKTSRLTQSLGSMALERLIKTIGTKKILQDHIEFSECDVEPHFSSPTNEALTKQEILQLCCEISILLRDGKHSKGQKLCSYSFWHRTIQEFVAALFLLEQIRKDESSIRLQTNEEITHELRQSWHLTRLFDFLAELALQDNDEMQLKAAKFLISSDPRVFRGTGSDEQKLPFSLTVPTELPWPTLELLTDSGTLDFKEVFEYYCQCCMENWDSQWKKLILMLTRNEKPQCFKANICYFPEKRLLLCTDGCSHFMQENKECNIIEDEVRLLCEYCLVHSFVWSEFLTFTSKLASIGHLHLHVGIEIQEDIDDPDEETPSDQEDDEVIITFNTGIVKPAVMMSIPDRPTDISVTEMQFDQEVDETLSFNRMPISKQEISQTTIKTSLYLSISFAQSERNEKFSLEGYLEHFAEQPKEFEIKEIQVIGNVNRIENDRTKVTDLVSTLSSIRDLKVILLSKLDLSQSPEGDKEWNHFGEWVGDQSGDGSLSRVSIDNCNLPADILILIANRSREAGVQEFWLSREEALKNCSSHRWTDFRSILEEWKTLQELGLCMKTLSSNRERQLKNMKTKINMILCGNDIASDGTIGRKNREVAHPTMGNDVDIQKLEDGRTELENLEEGMSEGESLEEGMTEGESLEEGMTEGERLEDDMTEGERLEDDMTENGSHIDSAMLKDIKAYLQLMCENVRRAWGKLLNETSLEKSFIEPQIVEEERDEQGKRRRKATGKSVSNYKELFDTFGDRIIIEGDPGMGKTTYVNKLALDWTLDEGSEHYSPSSQFLRSRFTIVFLIPLRSLNGSRATTLAQAASIQLDTCGSWLWSTFRAKPTECLLILDGFDEYDGSCQEINDIIDGSLFPHLKVIITTRPSHLERLNIRNQWLSITGLTTKHKRERFLIIQGWDKLQERDIIFHVLSSLGTLWHNPFYLAMLCVLYRAKKGTGFDPSNPNCFYVLVKSFADHIMARKPKEGTWRISREERAKFKVYMQKCAFDHFCQSNPWIADAFTISPSTPAFEDVKELARQFGLITIQEELNPVTGEIIEIISFVHQLFLEYYAAIEFGEIFVSSADKAELVKLIEKNIGLAASPFSYFLAAECKEYKEMLVNGQVDHCKFKGGLTSIHISQFPWLPEILISNDIYKKLAFDALQKVKFYCNNRTYNSFWHLLYVKELCSIVKPRNVIIEEAVLDYQDQSIDYILSLVNGLELWHCKGDGLHLDKQCPNLVSFKCDTESAMMLSKNFPNLSEAYFRSNISNHSIGPLCDSLQNMNQLEKLELNGCFKSSQSVQHIIQLAKTVETSSLCQTLKKLRLSNSILDTETESSISILMRAISKYVQLEKLYLRQCQIKVQSLDILKEFLQNSLHLRKNLSVLDVEGLYCVPPDRLTNDYLGNWKSEIGLILPHCYQCCAKVNYLVNY